MTRQFKEKENRAVVAAALMAARPIKKGCAPFEVKLL
jgi:hypothetical protein